MDKLTKQQEKGISKLLHHIHNERATQYILEVLGKENWTRPILIESCEYLSEEQEEFFNLLGGCYTSEELDEFMAEAFTNEKIGVASNPYAKEVLAILDKYFKR